jgi:23S rRNA-/tRNA-specific pseudouridylate synthase
VRIEDGVTTKHYFLKAFSLLLTTSDTILASSMNVARKANLQKEWELLKTLSECKFLTVASHGLCSEFISSEVCLKSTGVTSDELIRLGAVYVKKPTDIKPRRILTDVKVTVGDLIRVHPYPRRYPAFLGIDWKSALIHDSKQYIVVNKPAGIPSNPTVDNYYENIFIGASSKLNNGDELYLPHRLDTDTSGLIVLGKDKEFTTYFGTLLQRRQNINKRYKALLASDSARTISDIFKRLEIVEEIKSINKIGLKKPTKSLLLTSHQEKTSRSPKIFGENPTEGSLICQLALSSRTAPMTRSALEWIKWSDNLSDKNYDMKLIDKFKKGMRCWLDLRDDSCQQSLNNDSGEHTNSGPGSAANSEENLVIDANRNITFWEVDIELITGKME